MFTDHSFDALFEAEDICVECGMEITCGESRWEEDEVFCMDCYQDVFGPVPG